MRPTKFDGVMRISASTVVCILIVLGFPTLLVIVPLLSVSLASSYSEFSNEGIALMALFGTPVVLSQSLLGIVLVLLGRIRADRMFSPQVNKWVRLLAWNSVALAASFLTILFWFGAKNTTPPLVMLGLVVASLVALAVGFVTATLLGTLRQATAATEELEAVI